MKLRSGLLRVILSALTLALAISASAQDFRGAITGRVVDGCSSRARRKRWNRRATASSPTPYEP